MVLDPAADRPHHLPQRLARNREEALDPKNIEPPRCLMEAHLDLGRICYRRHIDDEALEIVLPVLLAAVVMRRAVFQIVLSPDPQAKGHDRVNSSMMCP